MDAKDLIIIPYAYGGNTGVSIQNTGRQLDTYMKNVCTAALSAKKNSGITTDVMVVSNIAIPDPYVHILKDHDVLIEYCAFDKFNFGKETKEGKPVSWQLAFYKLCALDHCVTKLDYNNYCFLDSDVFVQGSFANIWKESQNNIMLYDLNEPVDGYMVKEMNSFLHNDLYLSHYGGEFFAASRILAGKFICECLDVFERMVAADYVTTSGDEFITSIVASRLKPSVKNAAAYIQRYWTGSYRVFCNNYDTDKIAVLHLPAEKEQGIIKLFDKYISKGIVPDRKKVWAMTHLRHRSIRVRVGVLLRKAGLIK